MKVEIERNVSFKHLWHPVEGCRFYVEYGGAGSGKSYAIAQSIICECLKENRRWLAVRKVRNTIRHSVFDLLEHIISELGFDAIFAINRSDLSITCLITGAKIICTGLDDVAKLKSIHGITDIWIEEATELALNDFRQLNLRLRGLAPHKRILISFNPVSSISWLKSEFFDNPKNNALIHHSTYKDNRFIDEEYRQEIEALKHLDAYFYTVYALGEWGVLGNRIFTNFVIEDFDFHEDDLSSTRGGMDFGYNHASAIERAGFYDGEIYVYDELYAKRLTNTALIVEAKSLYGEPYDREEITADSAEPDRIEEFNNAGFSVLSAKKGSGSVRMGIDYLKRYKIHIHKTRCPNLARELPNMKWREDKDGNALDEPVEFNDDTVAALRYAVEDLWYGMQGMKVLSAQGSENEEVESTGGLKIVRPSSSLT